MEFGGLEGRKLPRVLVLQICLRLPLKSILRFKSVGKEWYAMFSSPNFIQEHYQMTRSSAKMNNLLSFLVVTRHFYDQTLSLLLDRPCGQHKLMNVNPPYFECDSRSIDVVGSINGLVCLNYHMKNTSTVIVLWNPATRQCSQIPNPKLQLLQGERVSVGFAYDQKTDTYKVIRILFPESVKHVVLSDNGTVTAVEIYNTKTNAWKTSQVVGLPYLCDQRTCGTVVSGFPYWYARDWVEPHPRAHLQLQVMWFDPVKEAFGSLPLPNSPPEAMLSLGVMAEHPVVFTRCSSGKVSKEDDRFTVAIWKLNRRDKGGKEEVYVEKLTMKVDHNLLDVAGFGRHNEIIGIDFSSDLVIVYPTQVKVIPQDAAWGAVRQLYDYTESLVSPPRVA